MNLAASLVVLSTVTLAVACGGGGEPTLVDYFAELEKAVDEFIADTDEVAVEQGFLVDFDDVSGTVSGFRTFLPEMIEAAEDFAAELGSLQPPPEATESHAASVAALEQFISASAATLEGLPSIATADALTTAYERYADSGSRFSQSCNTLQRVADEHGVVADLRCSP